MNESRDQDAEIDFSIYSDIVLRRRWIILSIFTIVFISTLLVTFTTRPVYQAAALLVIEKERDSGAVFANGGMLENSNDDYYQTQYKLLQSLSLMQRVYDNLKLDTEEDFKNPHGVDKLQRAVIISPVLRSRLVYVRVDSHKAELAARIANSVAENFVAQNLNNQLFISKEVLQALQIKGDAKSSRQAYDALPAVVNNSLIQNLKGEYSRLESQAAEMSQKFTPKHPAMIALRSSMEALKGQIQAETDKIVQSLKTELSGQLKGNNVRIVDEARAPDSPIKPNKRLALFLGLLGGLVAGLGAAFLVEGLDQSVRTQEDVENKLHLPFLGIIPLSAQKEAPVYDALLANTPSLTSEALRNIRTMVDFADVSQGARALLVASTVQSEGKTYIASNLAVVFAQLGESVLLIDGDLRRPNVHKNFALSTQRGLSNFLASGKDVTDVEDHIQDSDIPNLKVLTCGARPPNPSELLNTPRLGALVAWAKSNFDRVIIDCTPVFPISDTLLWGRHVPSCVYAVSYGKTRAPLILKGSERLQAGGMKILGVALNMARHGGLSYAAYGYYYQQYYHSYHQETVAGKAS